MPVYIFVVKTHVCVTVCVGGWGGGGGPPSYGLCGEVVAHTHVGTCACPTSKRMVFQPFWSGIGYQI